MTESTESTEEQKEVCYVCKQNPKFSFRLDVRRIQFVNGELRLTDKDEIAALDKLLKTNSTFTQKIKKVDKEAAETFVREQIASNNKNSGIIKGGTTSESIKAAQAPLKERDANFANMSPEQEKQVTEQMEKDSNLILTEKTNKPVTDSVENKPKTNLGNLLG